MEPEWDEIDDPSVIDCLQPNYSLLWRSIEPNVLPLCRRNDIGIITYSTLCQGILAGKFESLEDVPDDSRGSNQRLTEEEFPQVMEVVDVLREVAEAHGKTMAQTAIRWVLEQEGVTCAIVGASRPEQVDDNLGALGWELDAEACERLSEVSWPLSADLQPHDTLWNWHPREN
jgi:aryl-alcohol dehydrogenase-like predicted oxidoreductase